MVDDSPISPVELELVLAPLVGTAPTRALAARLAALSHSARYRAGDALHRDGERTGLVHFVVRGELELRSPGTAARRIEAPGAVGLVDFLQGRAHAHTAVALGDVRALVVEGDDWLDVLEEDADFAHALVAQGAASLLRLQLDLAPDHGVAAFAGEPAPRGGDAPPTLVSRIDALRGVAAFAGASVQSLATLASLAGEVTLAPGQQLRRQGDPAQSFLVVAAGVLRAERISPLARARFGPGSIVGGVAALGCAEHPYTSVAETAAVVLRIQHDVFFDVLEDRSDLLRAVLAELVAERELLLARQRLTSFRSRRKT